MPSLSSIAVLAVATLASSAAAGTAYIKNNCPYNVNVFTTGGSNPQARVTLAAGGTFSQPIRGTGASLQVSKPNVSGDNELDYSVTDNFYYSTGVGGADYGPFANDGLTIVPSVKSCPSIICRPGQFASCVRQTKACGVNLNSDVTFTVCVK